MRDVELLVPGADDAYAAEGAGQMPADTSQSDPAYTAADKANTMPGLGGELGVCNQTMVSGPLDGGLATLEAGATVTPPAAPVAKPAYALAGRSINPTTKDRLFPWIANPGTGLSSSYESNVPPGLVVAMGAVSETPGDEDDDQGDEEEEEGVEKKDDKSPAKRARLPLLRRKSK